jgi:dolichol-phosphate mannosyltransferase
VKVIGRFMRFGIVGGSGVLVDMAALYLLHDPKRLALPLAIAKILAAQLAILNNFAWNELWTFADRAAPRASAGQRVVRFARFEMICLVGLGLNLGVLTLLVKRLGFHYLVANAVAIGAATAWNFFVNLRFNWSATASPAMAAAAPPAPAAPHAPRANESR